MLGAARVLPVSRSCSQAWLLRTQSFPLYSKDPSGAALSQCLSEIRPPKDPKGDLDNCQSFKKRLSRGWCEDPCGAALWNCLSRRRYSSGTMVLKDPSWAALKDCLSPENEARCRRELASNGVLYTGGRTVRTGSGTGSSGSGTGSSGRETGSSGLRAAVLVSLCTVGGQPAFLLTLRSSKLTGRHKGDVSFAGGKADPVDRDVIETALREAREELGVRVRERTVWGLMRPLRDWSGMVIAPVIANLGPLEALPLNPNPDEDEPYLRNTEAAGPGTSPSVLRAAAANKTAGPD
ncbi:uncharacterized protein LOC121307192 [Polyodon spathula]|uniref:uncharacterized protein LOC121307192 n=1 Tax=Polyodon spathula TaxID=7913 RepID=UPI001B7E998F|nr:uncharacterized protein LOC121307192 [Polyodon spathula]